MKFASVMLFAGVQAVSLKEKLPDYYGDERFGAVW